MATVQIVSIAGRDFSPYRKEIKFVGRRLGPSWAIASDSASPAARCEPTHPPTPLKSYWIPHEWPSLSASFITLRLHGACLICSKFAASSPQLLWSSSTEAQNETSREKKNVRKRPCNQIKLTLSTTTSTESSVANSHATVYSQSGGSGPANVY